LPVSSVEEMEAWLRRYRVTSAAETADEDED